MPSYRHHDHGNMYIKFNVVFPPSNFNTPEAIAKLEEILPARNTTEVPADAMVDDVVLEDVDPREQGRSQGGATGMDEDDEGQGGERVQCASQ